MDARLAIRDSLAKVVFLAIVDVRFRSLS